MVRVLKNKIMTMLNKSLTCMKFQLKETDNARQTWQISTKTIDALAALDKKRNSQSASNQTEWAINIPMCVRHIVMLLRHVHVHHTTPTLLLSLFPHSQELRYFRTKLHQTIVYSLLSHDESSIRRNRRNISFTLIR